jgi:twitching motility protein PilT
VSDAAVLELSDSTRSLEVAARILRGAIAAGASDIHLRVGSAPMVRIEGQLCPLDHPVLDTHLVRSAIDAMARSADISVADGGDLDFSCELPNIGRFRAHVYRERGAPAVVLRHVPNEIPDFATLRLPPIIKRIAANESGLVLVCGATGNGKSTTIASILQYINENMTKHVVTVEEPIEYVFRNQNSSFSQRAVRSDVAGIEKALESAMREDPDVIFVGEIRSPTEFEASLRAAESGRLVVSTFHSADSVRAISRMIHMYPAELREGARHRLADTLAAIICQRLVPMRGSRQRVLVAEVLVRSPTVQDCIRDPARLKGIVAALERGENEYGTQTFDRELLRLVRDGTVGLDTARSVATSPNDLARALKLTR